MRAMFNAVANLVTNSTQDGSGGGTVTPPLGDLGEVWNIGQVSIDSLYWPQVFKSSENPWATTSKKYFVFYSTDHDIADGGIYWGEMDSPFFTGFVERGLIKDGSQTETPWVITIPEEERSIAESVFLFYHTSENTQMTRLITSNGGVLHNINWTNRGSVYNIEPTDTHLGYTKVYRRGFQDYVAIHSVASGGVRAVSYASDPSEIFQRQYIIDQYTAINIPANSKFAAMEGLTFDYNSELYKIGLRNLTDGSGDKFIALYKANNDFFESEYLTDITTSLGSRMSAYKEGNYVYCYHKAGDNSNIDEPYHCFVFDLRDFV